MTGELSRSSIVAAIVWLDQLVAAAKDKRAELASELESEARNEYDQQGTAPTWRFPDVARVSSRVSSSSVRVVDEAKFAQWVAENHPEGIETVTRVKASWQSAFLAGGIEPGQEIPGVERVPGGRFLGVSVVAEREAKRMLGALAGRGLRLAALEAGPVVAPAFAEIEAGPEGQE